METKRVLLIEKLVVAIPDDVKSEDGRDEISIADAFEYLAKFYRTAECAMHNKEGNYKYFFSNMPESMLPSDPVTMKTNDLMQYVIDDPESSIGGCIASLIFDEEIGGYYRNAYTEKEMKVFEERKKLIGIGAEEEASDETDDNTPSCSDCDSICDEVCPDDPGSFDRMKDGE